MNSKKQQSFDIARYMARQTVALMAMEHTAALDHETTILDAKDGVGDGWACRQCDPDIFPK